MDSLQSDPPYRDQVLQGAPAARRFDDRDLVEQAVLSLNVPNRYIGLSKLEEQDEEEEEEAEHGDFLGLTVTTTHTNRGDTKDQATRTHTHKKKI